MNPLSGPMDKDKAHWRFGALVGGIQYSLENNKSTQGTHAAVTSVYLKKYLDAANMHHTFANQAHEERNYSEASTHMGHVYDALSSGHQVAHYNLGEKHPITKAFSRHMPKLRSELDHYRQHTETHDKELGERFEGLMKSNNLNPQQFS